MLPAVGHRLISSVILCNTSSGIGVDSNLLLATPLLAYERILRRSWMIDSNDLSITDGDETESVFLVTLKDTSDKQHSVLTLRCTGKNDQRSETQRTVFNKHPTNYAHFVSCIVTNCWYMRSATFFHFSTLHPNHALRPDSSFNFAFSASRSVFSSALLQMKPN